MSPRPSAQAQCGAVLMVALVMLLMMTLLALAGITASQLESRLAGNRAELARTFNAAESALREVERRLARETREDDGRGTSCIDRKGLCVLLAASVRSVSDERWRWHWGNDPDAWWGQAQNAVDYLGSDNVSRFEHRLRQHAAFFASDGGGLNLGNLGEPQLRTDYYYVDAFASGDAGRTPVILQSVFARRYAN
ncbi:hypothetical protein DK254_25025 [Pseudomonas sp. RW407]|uniref:pilus assembly PilX family protein n=1 Tax=Pseudomonas sp. RW407 TaxID=2202894 RepID=UPI000D6F52E8|nr:PilX N-terminal domain-containing pilus assembly protein [Pseudomonas sp. RW407]PWU25890.1 hypothetical protein DK254_25025 [Pseudomonas sp. RW407]